MLRSLMVAICAALAANAQSLHAPLVGTVTDPAGNPVAGATVEVWRAGGRGTGLLDIDYKNAFRRLARTPTDRRGHFAVQLLVGLPCRVIVDQPPFARYLCEDRLPGANLTIRLQHPAKMSGRILLHDGSPAAARLRVWNRDTRDEVARGETDEQGRYVFDRLAPGPLYVSVWPERGPAPNWYSIDLAAGDEHTYDVQLERGETLTGRVVDADTGEPIAGAKIAEGWAMRRCAVSDRQGRFALHGFGSAGYRDVHCRAHGYVRRVLKPSRTDPPELLVPLRRGHTTRGRILDESGRPLADAYVQVFGRTRNGHDPFHSCLSARTDDDGRFQLRGLREDLHPVLVVRKDGFATIVLALPEADAGVRKAGDVTLPRPRIVRGVLVDENGEPVADTQLSLYGHNADRFRLAPDGPLAFDDDRHSNWRMLASYVGRRTCRTDERGEFAFGDIPAGTWRLVVHDPKLRPIAEGQPFEVTVDRDPAPLRVPVPRDRKPRRRR